MRELYRLDKITVPTMITPHDCIIKEIKKEHDFLIFVFEEDLALRDSISFYKPTAKSLVIKYHLTDEYDIYYRTRNKLRRRFEYIEVKNEKSLFQSDSAYLSQYVMYHQVIIKLFKGREYLLFLTADYAEYDWIE